MTYTFEFSLNGENWIINEDKKYKSPEVPIYMLVTEGIKFISLNPQGRVRVKNIETGQIIVERGNSR